MTENKQSLMTAYWHNETEGTEGRAEGWEVSMGTSPTANVRHRFSVVVHPVWVLFGALVVVVFPHILDRDTEIA